MRILVVEDEPKIKTETIDDCLGSLGHVSDWAQNQQEANGLLATSDYDLILLDLQIPSRPNGKASPEFGKNLLKQIRARKGPNGAPVILMTAQHQHCVDLLTDLQEIGIDGSISKPFPTAGRTLAVVIEDVLEKHRRYRVAAKTDGNPPEQRPPFPGGVLAYHPRYIELCGETIAEKSRRGYAWQILQILREPNHHGRRLHIGSQKLADRLAPPPIQNTAVRAVSSLRSRVAKMVQSRLGYECGREDLIAKDDLGYHLADGIVIEVHDEEGTIVGQAGGDTTKGNSTKPGLRLSKEQRWVMAQLASEGTLTRREVEIEFDVSKSTAKRIMRDLTEVGLIEFNRNSHPGFYQLVEG